MWIGQRLGGWRHQICFPRRFLGHDGSIVNLLDGTQLLSMLGRHICFVMVWPDCSLWYADREQGR